MSSFLDASAKDLAKQPDEKPRHQYQTKFLFQRTRVQDTANLQHRKSKATKLTQRRAVAKKRNGVDGVGIENAGKCSHSTGTSEISRSDLMERYTTSLRSRRRSRSSSRGQVCNRGRRRSARRKYFNEHVDYDRSDSEDSFNKYAMAQMSRGRSSSRSGRMQRSLGTTSSAKVRQPKSKSLREERILESDAEIDNTSQRSERLDSLSMCPGASQHSADRPLVVDRESRNNDPMRSHRSEHYSKTPKSRVDEQSCPRRRSPSKGRRPPTPRSVRSHLQRLVRPQSMYRQAAPACF